MLRKLIVAFTPLLMSMVPFIAKGSGVPLMQDGGDLSVGNSDESIEWSFLAVCANQSCDDFSDLLSKGRVISFNVVVSEPTKTIATQTYPISLMNGESARITIKFADFGAGVVGIPISVKVENIEGQGRVKVLALKALKDMVNATISTEEFNITVDTSFPVDEDSQTAVLVTGGVDEALETSFLARCLPPEDNPGVIGQVGFDLRYYETSGECEDIVQHFSSLKDGEYAADQINFDKKYLKNKIDPGASCSTTSKQATFAMAPENIQGRGTCVLQSKSRWYNASTGKTHASPPSTILPPFGHHQILTESEVD